MSAPYAVPTALTHLFHSPEALRDGDGMVVVFPDGRKRSGTVCCNDGKTAEIVCSGGEVFDVAIRWEDET